jgi:ATP-dependent RNA helicase RhlE
MSFQNLGLGPKALQSIADAGYTAPTPIQSSAIPHVAAGRDLIGIAQTGTGKTAAFVLPILERLAAAPQHGRGPRALIVAPTRELAAQIDEAVRLLGRHHHVRCTTVFGGVGEQPQIQALRRGTDIVVATPGRLLDLMQSKHVSLASASIVVLDEADRMLDMGFLPQIRRVVAALPKKRQTLLFSATLSKDIEKIASELLTKPELVEIGRRANPADTVEQFLYPVAKSRKVDLLLHLLLDQKLDSVLVFSRTKHGADKIARKLVAAGVSTATLHSNRSQGQRTQALAAFRAGRVRVLVATDIAARGIDVEGISHVVNFDFPMHAEDYVHRIGRTGRAEAVGDAISFVTPDDEEYVRLLEKMIRKSIKRRKVEGFDYSERTIEAWRPSSTTSTAPHRAAHHAPTASRGRSFKPSQATAKPQRRRS